MESPTLPEKIQAFLSSDPVDEDGEPQGTKLLPGLKEEEIENLEKELGFQLPDKTRDLLRSARGFEEGPMEIVDFVGSPADCFTSFGTRTGHTERFQRMVLATAGSMTSILLPEI